MESPLDRWIADTVPSERYTHPLACQRRRGDARPRLAALVELGARWPRRVGLAGRLRAGGHHGPRRVRPRPQRQLIVVLGGYLYLNMSLTRLYGVRFPGLTPEMVDFQYFGEMPGITPYAEEARPTDESEVHTGRLAAVPGLDLQPRRPARAARRPRPDRAARGAAARPRPSWACRRSIDHGRSLPAAAAAAVLPPHRRCRRPPASASPSSARSARRSGSRELTLTLIAGSRRRRLGGAVVGDVGPEPDRAKRRPALTAAFDAGLAGAARPHRARWPTRGDADAAEFWKLGPRVPRPVREPRPERVGAAQRRPGARTPTIAAGRRRPHAPRRRRRLAAGPHRRAGRRARGGDGRRSAQVLAGNPEALGQFEAGAAGGDAVQPRPGAHQDQLHHGRPRDAPRGAGAGAAARRRGAARRAAARSSCSSTTELDDLVDARARAPDVGQARPRPSRPREREAFYLGLFDVEPPFVTHGAPAAAERVAARGARRARWPRAGTVLSRHPGLPRRGDAGGPGSSSTPPTLAASSRATCSWRRSPTRRGRRCSCPPRRSWSTSVPRSATPSSCSRELGLPCVVSVTGATRTIPDGALVEVDGDAGTVTILETRGGLNPHVPSKVGSPTPPPSTRFPVYTRSNANDVLPDAGQPARGHAGVDPRRDRGVGATATSATRPSRPRSWPATINPTCGFFNGYLYVNASVVRVFGERSGAGAAAIDAAFFGNRADTPPYVAHPDDLSEEASGAHRRPDGLGDVGHRVPRAGRHRRPIADAPAARSARPRRPDRRRAGGLRPLDGAARAAVLRRPRRHQLEHRRRSRRCSPSSPAAIDPELMLRLIASSGDVDSALPSYAMWFLSREANASAEVTAAFDAGVGGLLDRLRASGRRGGAAWLAHFERFLDDYGSRGPNEWDPYYDSWETRPELALALIDRMRGVADADSPVDPARRGHRRPGGGDGRGAGRAWPTTRRPSPRCWPPRPRRIAVPRRGGSAARRTASRRSTRCAWRCSSWAAGMAARRSPGRAEAGLHADRRRARRLPRRPGRSVTGVLDERQAAWEALGRARAALLRRGRQGHAAAVEPAPARAPRPSSWPSPATCSRGAPGCAGVARGPARIITDPGDPFALEPGDVLIAPQTDPSWTPLFVPAAAGGRRRRGDEQPRRHREPRAGHPVRGVGHRRQPAHPRRRDGRGRRRRRHRHPALRS